MVNGPVSNHISKLLANYKNISATKKDIVDVLDAYNGLNYALEKFVFNDGTVKDLFKLHGTIPVVYKNNTYHIPICIWLMDTHPNNAPLCFVKPTSDMHIKVSRFVDHNGKIYLPYLHDWQPSQSDLLGLIQVMIVTFGDFPPVYSKPKENTTPYPTQSFMPQPPSAAGGYMPPYPTGGSAFPPYPSGAATNFPPYPSGQPTQPGYPHFTGSNFPPMPGFGSPTATATAGSGTITEEHIKASLISAVEDKLRRKIQERVNQCQAEMETLNRTKQELTEGRSKIDVMMNKLDRDSTELKSNIKILQEKEQSLQKSLDSLENVNGIDVDEAVVTTAPLYRQLLNTYAEEAAIEDVIYYLGEAIRGGVIDLETFLKLIRQLSRKQFMLRALMQKCRQKAGLAG